MQRSDFAEQVTVVVGPERECFIVHKHLICRSSAFFKAATSLEWQNNNKKSIELPDDDPKIFGAYLLSLYTTTITPQAKEAADLWDELAMLYVLADKLRDLKTANLILEQIMTISDQHKRIAGNKTITKIYANTTDGSPLRRLVVDYQLHEPTVMPPSSALHDLPKHYLQDFLTAYLRVKTGAELMTSVKDLGHQQLTKVMPKCRYHQHDETHPVEGNCTVKAGENAKWGGSAGN
ncbi:hypothetical protein LTR17_018799 [Elasticomyces elasticus]|nr:hypothetical protein LTR17_018799 [Elasticomyces elasticus]